MQEFVGVTRGGSGAQYIAKDCRRTPAFLEAKRGPQSLPGKIETAGLIAVDIAPSSGARCVSRSVASEGDGACAGDHNQTRLSRGRASQGDQGVICYDHPIYRQNFVEDCLLVFWAAAETEAGSREPHIVQSRIPASGAYTSFDGANEFGAAFRRSDVVAGTAAARSKHTAGLVADKRGGARLAAVDTQEIFAHFTPSNRYSRMLPWSSINVKPH